MLRMSPMERIHVDPAMLLWKAMVCACGIFRFRQMRAALFVLAGIAGKP